MTFLVDHKIRQTKILLKLSIIFMPSLVAREVIIIDHSSKFNFLEFKLNMKLLRYFLKVFIFHLNFHRYFFKSTPREKFILFQD